MSPRDPVSVGGSARYFFLFAAIAGAFAIISVILGGFDVRWHGFRLSSHGFLRPLLVSLASLIVGFWRLPPGERGTTIDRWSASATRLLPWLVAVAATVVLVLGLTFGTRAAGGSDPFGYISQSRLWMHGDLRVRQPYVEGMPWPDADWTFTPLGYRPAPGHTLVPTYSPGLPLLMALFTLVLGNCGPFLVGPACGAALVVLTYFLGVRLSGRVVAAIAALSIAASPTVLFMSLWPMSDVPCAAFWTASLLLASLPGWTAAASGAAAGIAIAIRPNLVPLALVPLAVVLWGDRDGRPRLARGGLAFCAGCAPFVVFVAWLFRDLYGSPLESGYGGAATLFALDNVAANLRRYPVWLAETQTPIAFLFAFAVFLRDRQTALRRAFVAFVAIVWASYLVYLPFEAWWYLRFLLPAFPLMFILMAEVAAASMARFGERARAVTMVLLAVLTVGFGAARSDGLHVLDIGAGEQKYADVGRYLAAHLPERAVVVCMQHSGSVRFYARRPTLRFDLLDTDWLDRATAHLVRAGYEVYVLLEDFELPRFRERFAGQRGVAVIDGPPMAVTAGRHVQLFRIDGNDRREQPTAIIPRTRGCEE